jgi:NADH-quinone oxidoreductase subunit L
MNQHALLSGLWLVPALPLAGFLALLLTRGALPRRAVAIIGVGSVGLSALMALAVGWEFLSSPPSGYAYTQTLWTWMAIADFTPHVALYLDPLALVMMAVVTVVGFLIHLYSSQYMADDEGYSRFFAYMNLFVASMLVLVLADNLLFLYLGWEAVGLCSYLLIGFWYRDPANGFAARKAFVITRVGDTAMLIGVLLLFTSLGTLDIQALLGRATAQWSTGSGLAVAAAALLLGGAVGKSAQLPLQTWLPDAMAGPTPVSALIHAATMVTAGVYLIARTHPLYVLAPEVQTAVAIIGALTLLLAGFSALAQSDIKRALAYSTISQIGYMFLALGVGAWPAAIFHFMTHAFFKALLFLAAGVVILALHHEQNIFKMGGLRRSQPVAFWTFLIGSASLAALPLVTAGFYSKDLILAQTWFSNKGGPWLWVAAWVGALLTALYAFRVVFIAFFGVPKSEVRYAPGLAMQLPLWVLAALAVVGGLVELPPILGHWALFSDFMQFSLPQPPLASVGTATEWLVFSLSSIASVGGLLLAYMFFQSPKPWAERLRSWPMGEAWHRLWYRGWGFDALYGHVFVYPVVWLAQRNRNDFIDAFYRGLAFLSQGGYRVLAQTQTGHVRWYAASIAGGAGLIIAVALFS